VRLRLGNGSGGAFGWVWWIAEGLVWEGASVYTG